MVVLFGSDIPVRHRAVDGVFNVGSTIVDAGVLVGLGGEATTLGMPLRPGDIICRGWYLLGRTNAGWTLRRAG